MSVSSGDEWELISNALIKDQDEAADLGTTNGTRRGDHNGSTGQDDRLAGHHLPLGESEPHGQG